MVDFLNNYVSNIRFLTYCSRYCFIENMVLTHLWGGHSVFIYDVNKGMAIGSYHTLCIL